MFESPSVATICGPANTVLSFGLLQTRCSKGGTFELKHATLAARHGMHTNSPSHGWRHVRCCGGVRIWLEVVHLPAVSLTQARQPRGNTNEPINAFRCRCGTTKNNKTKQNTHQLPVFREKKCLTTPQTTLVHQANALSRHDTHPKRSSAAKSSVPT